MLDICAKLGTHVSESKSSLRSSFPVEAFPQLERNRHDLKNKAYAKI